MNLKNKLRLGIGFLFVLLVLFGYISLHQINRIATSTNVILKDNYKTLQYTKQMRLLMDIDQLKSQKSINEFAKLVDLERKNVTEKGEQQLADALLKDVQAVRQNATINFVKIRLTLTAIEDLNLKAIMFKSNQSQKTVARATLYLGLLATVFFLILFTFIVNFPGYIANPLQSLLHGIREIGNKNYKKRLNFSGTDEFAALAQAFNQMATKLDGWENSNLALLKSEKRRIEIIIEQMNDAVIGIDELGKIVFINHLASKLLNINPAKAVGADANTLRSSNNLLDNLMQHAHNDEMLQINDGDKPAYFRVEYRPILVPQVANEESVLLQSAKQTGEVYILKNITEFTEKDLAKTNFIATISHELKTPLASIKMSTKLLEDYRIGTLSNEQKAMVSHINDDANRLLKITSELLNLAQVETGNIQLNIQTTPAKDIITYATAAVKVQLEQKDINLQVLMQPNLPPVFADREKSAWVLINFLSNALRYSIADSTIIVSAQSIRNQVVFAVQDFGKGIDQKYQHQIFNRYFQVPTDGQHQTGSGLGLSIAKDFIEAQGGKIWLESELGVGSKFHFTLPMAT